ncbi:hypothetical protein AUJ14_02050 [Candidatus Micrarchaeota archaeon CG1_02_55_22]|nr:MAG: hypothetical protein AUJ14_02050 [Candidatus Micrarchaeota archaeon CG1_02_55_22]
MDKGILMNVVLAMVLIVGLLQAVELNSLSTQRAAPITTASASVQAPAQQAAAAPNTQASGDSTLESLNNLPSMVGGC